MFLIIFDTEFTHRRFFRASDLWNILPKRENKISLENLEYAVVYRLLRYVWPVGDASSLSSQVCLPVGNVNSLHAVHNY